MRKNTKRSIITILTIMAVVVSPLNAYAAPKNMPDGQVFDPEFYAQNNPDVVAALGTDEAALYNHYKNYGKAEGRKPYNINIDFNYWTDYEKLDNKGNVLQHPFQIEFQIPEGLNISKQELMGCFTDQDIVAMAKEIVPAGTQWGMKTYYDLLGYKRGNGVPKRGQSCQAFAYWLTDAIFGTTPAYCINKPEADGSIVIRTYDIICYGQHAIVVLGVDGEKQIVTAAEGGFNGTVNWGRTVTFDEIFKAGNFAIIRREGI